MSALSLSCSGSTKTQDPVAEATRRGKVPTLGEVKRSLKVLQKPHVVTGPDSFPLDSDQKPYTSHDPDGCATKWVDGSAVFVPLINSVISRTAFRDFQALLLRQHP